MISHFIRFTYKNNISNSIRAIKTKIEFHRIVVQKMGRNRQTRREKKKIFLFPLHWTSTCLATIFAQDFNIFIRLKDLYLFNPHEKHFPSDTLNFNFNQALNTFFSLSILLFILYTSNVYNCMHIFSMLYPCTGKYIKIDGYFLFAKLMMSTIYYPKTRQAKTQSRRIINKCHQLLFIILYFENN